MTDIDIINDNDFMGPFTYYVSHRGGGEVKAILRKPDCH